MKKLVGLVFCLMLHGIVQADVQIKSGASTDTWTVNTQKAGLVQNGISTRPTYMATVGAQVTTAAILLSVESSAGTGFKLASWCVSFSNATAAAVVNVTVQRRTTASTGGTALTAEGTGTTAISKFDPADGNYGGVARLGGTPGTAGAMLDQAGFFIGELGAGTADPAGQGTFCKRYGTDGEKMPIVAAGVANGLSISLSTHGAGALADGAISAVIIQE